MGDRETGLTEDRGEDREYGREKKPATGWEEKEGKVKKRKMLRSIDRLCKTTRMDGSECDRASVGTRCREDERLKDRTGQGRGRRSRRNGLSRK